MDLIIASDTHIAEAWDLIDKQIPLEEQFFNPNEQLRNLVTKIKKNQKIIINGDIIDYFYTHYEKKEGCNWDLFEKIIEESKGEYLLNMGNHEYREIPYNMWFFRKRNVNLSMRTVIKYIKPLRLTRFRFIKEFESFTVNKKRFNPALRYRFKEYYTKVTDKAQLVFLNTGPDAITNIRNLLKIHNWRAMIGSNPPASGLTNPQIKFLNKTIVESQKKEIIIFLHAPPLFTKKRNIKKLKLNKKNGLTIMRSGMVDGIFLKNNWNFIKTLLNNKNNFLVVNSHLHSQRQFLLDKKDLIVEEVDEQELNEKRDNQRYIKLISTLPLGAIGHENKSGYIHITNKNIKHITTRKF